LGEAAFFVEWEDSMAKKTKRPARDVTVILSKGQKVKASEIKIPDLWHLAMEMRAKKDIQASEMILECWYLAHNLLRHIRGD
jgi:hypothetical protein